ncbi:hypothetical protein [Bacillus sp. 3255]|uniref:hypothetical protein n=1 Tax=Bacillus sp. 3255 TaxID=2817904 RepID=UPI002866A3A7|nr:hypothetical protein [Bacillus sp. 3255]MDR6883049.1 O-methyltransferase involved in polyketide biosynthesis [Bacillus sp. 3255]
MKKERVEIYLLPQIVIHGKTYRATNFRWNHKGKKWAEVDYWIDGRGWQAVHDIDKIGMVARLLWSQRTE